jgi:hypothetical protein
VIALEPHPEGVVVPVRASTAARRNAVTGVRDGMLRVSVTQAPERGKANEAIMVVLAKALGVRKSQVELVSGATSRQKRFLIRNVTAAGLGERIADVVQD